MALLRQEWASKAEYSSVACVSVSGSLPFLDLCTASSPLPQNHFWHLLHLQSTSLFFYCLCSLSQALMPLPFTGLTESCTFHALYSHILCLHRCSSHPGSLSHCWSHCQALCGFIFEGWSIGLSSLSCLAHWHTANPPLLLNQRPHIKHSTAPSCSCPGFWCSSVYLSLALSDSLLKHPHTLHFTSCGAISLLLFWSCWCLESPSLHVTYHCFLCCASSYHLSPGYLQPSGHSSSWISLGMCYRKPAKQVDLWDSLRAHSG